MYRMVSCICLSYFDDCILNIDKLLQSMRNIINIYVYSIRKISNVFHVSLHTWLNIFVIKERQYVKIKLHVLYLCLQL